MPLPRLIDGRLPPALVAVAVAVAAVLGSASCSGPGAERAGERPRRIVLVTLDTLRLDSFTGSDERPSSMPETLARAERGAVFERFFAATSTTQPSHASMLTGLHPWQHGVTRNGQVLGDEHETVTERLATAGYRTAAVVASFPLSARFGWRQGFDHYDDRFEVVVPGRRPFEAHPVPEDRFFNVAETVTGRALAWLDEAPGENQFLWLHYFDPHQPYGYATGAQWPSVRRIATVAENGGDVATVIARARRGYELDVAYLDRWLARLLTRLDEEAERFETHVVVASDHGESFGEGGSLGHGRRLSDEQLRVPLFILSPRVEAGRRSDVAGSVDVATTLLALAGLPAREGLPAAAGGRDLTVTPPPRTGARGMRRSFGPRQVERRLDGSEHPLGPLFYVVDRGGSILRGNRAGLVDPPPALAPGRRLRLTGLFAAFEDALAARGAGRATDPEVRRALSALGYVD